MRTTAGLSEEQLRAPGVPSGTSLLGLVWHLAEMETHWFRRVFAGADLPITGALQAPDNLSATEVVAAYRAACGQSDQVVRDADGLDAVSQGTARLPASTAADAPPAGARLVSLREVAVHMIEETARHAGHADIIREQLDGATDL